MTTDPSATFEPHRRRLLGLAYRMLGSMAEAEDAVQETYLRWHDADRAGVENARALARGWPAGGTPLRFAPTCRRPA